MANPSIPRRIHSLSTLGTTPPVNYAALVADSQFSFLPSSPSPRSGPLNLSRTHVDPPNLITVSYALTQAEHAVNLDVLEQYDQALFHYREAIMSLKHLLYWESLFAVRGVGLSTQEERDELAFIQQKYASRVVEIGGSAEYSCRPDCHKQSVWASTGGVRAGLGSPALTYILPQERHSTFTLAEQLLLSVSGGAFITPNLYVSPLIWQADASLALSGTKASYLEAMVPHYTSLLAQSTAESRYEALDTLKSILAMLQSTLSKQDDHSDKLWSNVSPLLKGNSFNQSYQAKEREASSNASLKSQRKESHLRDSYIDNIHASKQSIGSSMPMLSTSPPQPKRNTLKQKFKRLTQKSDKEAGYVTNLVAFLKALLKVEGARRDRAGEVKADKSMRDWDVGGDVEQIEEAMFEEHLGFVHGVVFGFVIGDLEVLMQAYFKSLVKLN